jgi:5-oxoprolinase (ATP-hydrolysing)
MARIHTENAMKDLSAKSADRSPGVRAPVSRSPAIELELFQHRFAAIAAEMGELLRRSALSTNVRDRLDYSCGLLDAAGELVVNAPHIPVHLGALGLCVRTVEAALPLGPGDVAITNHPAFGGSHLPDITLISPVLADGVRLGYVASRAHHAEIGGKRPGSMPPDARNLAEEGVVIAPRLLVAAGRDRFAELASLLEEGPWPSRAPEENLADLQAALAANRAGVKALEALAARHGAERVAFFMARQKEDAARRLAAALEKLPLGELAAEERLDDGHRIAVKAKVFEADDGRRLELDFAGTSATHPGNLNATPAIVHSAVLYVLRLLLAEDLPLNEGLLQRVELKLPECFLAPAFHPDPAKSPAVVGGNTETSQRLVDTLVKAFGLLACGQGTMNNLLFGDATFGYYETVCGGAGAGPGFAGASAVHTHMTNTRITDPEILEWRFPVRLERFEIRRGSGGKGKFPGGDGAIRELLFLRRLELSILSQHRVEAPFGRDGGKPGQIGRQRLLRANGEEEELAGVAQASVEPGDRLLLETPGGGGWGA